MPPGPEIQETGDVEREKKNEKEERVMSLIQIMTSITVKMGVVSQLSRLLIRWGEGGESVAKAGEIDTLICPHECGISK